MPQNDQQGLDRRRNDAHLDKVEDRLDQILERLTETISEVVRLESELRSEIRRVDSLDGSIAKIETAIDSLNEAKMNMMLLTRTIHENEKKIADLEIEQGRQREQTKIADWFFKIAISVAGVAVAIWAVIVQSEK